MERFSTILSEATADIGQEYFLLPVHQGKAVPRERVYCYELYHQIRLKWPPGQNYLLNGEVDKSGHPRFEELGKPQPDLLVHEPNTDNNYAVLEVKPCHARKSGIAKDVKNLLLFKRELGYQRAIYLIYGSNAEKTCSKIHRWYSDLQGFQDVELWCHIRVGSAAARFDAFRQP